MTIVIDVEDVAWNEIPGLEDVTRRAIAAGLAHQDLTGSQHDISVVFTSDEAMAVINRDWRGKDGPTNVLSFPAGDMPVPDGEASPLGDLVLAYGTVSREAAEQGKSLPHHATHLMIHGLLHLLGFDHENHDEAGDMERHEIEILKGLGISNPYERP